MGTTAPTQPQPRLLVELLAGKLRGVTSLVVGGDAVAEARTPNAVMCMYGTSFIMIFTPPGTSEFIGLDGLITVQNRYQAIPEIELVRPNFRTLVVQREAPVTAVEVDPAEVQPLMQRLVVIAQAPEQDAVVVPDTEVPPVVTTLEEPVPNTAPVMPPDMMTPDTTPPSVDAIRNSILDFIIVFPR
jgi:hypothetical protein